MPAIESLNANPSQEPVLVVGGGLVTDVAG
jgi:hypothetical protein